MYVLSRSLSYNFEEKASLGVLLDLILSKGRKGYVHLCILMHNGIHMGRYVVQI